MKKAEALVAKLPVFRAALVEIEARALPQTEDERAADRQSHPRSAELARKRSQLEWQSRMLGEIPWPSPASAETEIARDTSPADASALNVRAWRLVDPEDPVHGSEEKALLLSRRAVALAPDATRAEYRDTLAWALFRLGRLDDALAEERRALEEAGPSKRVEFEGYAAKLESAVNRWRGDARSKRVEERESAEREVAAIEAEVSKRRAWGFANDDDRWWRAQMEKLIGALTAFADERNGLYRGLFAEHGWSIARRLEFASSIEERSVSGAEARAQWSEAIAAIRASKRYAGLQLAPQVGLVPLGMDPVSRLWEFAHLQTGDAPQRGADGKLILTEATGLVFVLVPGTSFDMGAQSADPDAANYDPQARDEESPVHQVTLSPYFLSKYEMTQAQWLRTTGRNPSSYSPVDRLARLELNLLHPVEQVTWLECDQVMSRLGLRLPSEAQWENGCRAGTDSPWWTGSDRETLRGQVNLADQAGARGGATWQEIQDWPDLDDGFAVHAPVGSFAPNPFGLHEVHANVWEWCADGKGAYAEENPIDPLAPAEGAHDRVCRGGSFQNAAALARSSIRDFGAPALQHDSIGLRPARVLVR
jgi:formylglycine-generating enzyme required for sulfatase activity